MEGRHGADIFPITALVVVVVAVVVVVGQGADIFIIKALAFFGKSFSESVFWKRKKLRKVLVMELLK